MARAGGVMGACLGLSALLAQPAPATSAGPGGLPGPAAGCPGTHGIAAPASTPWAQQALSFSSVWPLTQGAGVTVAVVDSGVDANPQFGDRVTAGPDLAAAAAFGAPPDADCVGHGTSVASIIAAAPMPGISFAGVAPGAAILSVKITNSDSILDEVAARAIRDAVNLGAQVINLSLATTVSTPALQAAVQFAQDHNVVVVAAAGNDAGTGSGFTPYSYPASFPGVISVAAVDASGHRAFFSDRNASVVISAPGVNIIGAGPGGSYLEGSGTSPAAAFVAGVAALIRSRYPRLDPAQVEQAMISSASRRPAGGYSPDAGFGEVDAPAALTAAARLAAQAPQTGLAAGAHFGRMPGPIQVVHRDERRIAGFGAAGAALALAGLALLAWLIARIRRRDAGHSELQELSQSE